ncbi:MAG: PAS domain-containing protein [Planctomycetes bacterium]|nr:PAS domain-containing protein [Planctomycetota bacterium]
MADPVAQHRELERERMLFARGPVVVFRWLPEPGWPVVYVSANVAALFGHSAEDLLSGRVAYARCLHPHDLHRVAEEVAEHTRTGRDAFEQEYRIVRPDGTVRWLHDFTVITRDEQGRVIEYAGYVVDTTARRAAEEAKRELEVQVLHAQKLESLGVLAGGIAHDFNNLLTGILGHAELARIELPADSPAHASLEQVVATARRAAELTAQMLAYSGRSQRAVQSLDLSGRVDEIAAMLRFSISKKARLELELARGLPPIDADAAQIQQLVMNLITNASDALGERSGTILVRTGLAECSRTELAATVGRPDLPPGPYVRLEVSDEGEGMPPEILSRVFEPFFTTKFTGRGLGLAAALGIVRGHRAAIRVRTEVGRGSTFEVFFPPGEGRALAPPPPPARPVAPARQQLILVVDDEDTVRNYARKVLERAGFRTLGAANGRAALEAYAAHGAEIAAVLLDLTMPEMDGRETLVALRRVRPDLPVILSSGYTENEVSEHAAPGPRTRFLHKPYEPRLLAEMVGQVLAVQA